MTPLSRDELELIFDYCLGVATAEQLEQCRQLIANKPEAADFFSKVQQSISPLDNWVVENCPEDLVERTIAHVNDHAQASQQRLEQLIAEQKTSEPSARETIWGDIARRLAMAAVFMIVGGILLSVWPAINHARSKARQVQCQAQLGRIWQGINNYSSDYGGRLPAVATSAGSPWWKVGYQGKENVSNTRHIWLLSKGGYVKPGDFICPGIKMASLEPISLAQARRLHDFPDRRYISYSLRLICGQPKKVSELGNRVIISDMNPLFETLPSDFNQTLKLKLDDKLLGLNSINHKRRGQNVLFGDGAVKFIKTRQVDITNDDIFTLRNQNVYEGVEVPTCESDAFLAP